MELVDFVTRKIKKHTTN